MAGRRAISVLAELSFLFPFAGLTGTGKETSVMGVETHFDPTAVHSFGRRSSNRMPLDMFADCDFILVTRASGRPKAVGNSV